jgi:CBS domain-containing protein
VFVDGARHRNCEGLYTRNTTMDVSHVMSSPPATCRATTQLGQAAKMMADHNRGCLPVVDDGGHLIGLITDRDISLTVADRHRNPWQLAVREAMTTSVVSCAPDDPIDKALKIFSDLGVRRLPVVDRAGHVKGVLSIDDLVMNAGEAGLPGEAVLRTIKNVCNAETGKPIER